MCIRDRQEPSCGGVPFRIFFQQTPQVLLQPPYKLFDTVAVPLYSSPEHRKVSLRHVLRSMGAAPCDAAALTRCLRICRRHILEAPIAIPGKSPPGKLHCGETNSFDGRGAVDGANRVDGIPLEEPIVGEPASFQRVVLWHSSLEDRAQSE